MEEMDFDHYLACVKDEIVALGGDPDLIDEDTARNDHQLEIPPMISAQMFIKQLNDD